MSPAAKRVIPAAERDESPLAWLARRRGPDGRPLLDAAQVAAGERLGADFGFAGLQPRVTLDWSALGGGGRSGRRTGGGGGVDLGDAAMAARRRVDAALAAVGPELSAVLVDVCCFEKGLVAVERERGWPARAAKVVLALGLDRLAAHYGIARQASGPETSPGIRRWGTADYRPTIG